MSLQCNWIMMGSLPQMGQMRNRCEEGKEAAQVHLWSKVLHSEAQLSGDTEVEMCVPELRK